MSTGVEERAQLLALALHQPKPLLRRQGREKPQLKVEFPPWIVARELHHIRRAGHASPCAAR
jgi:hypothetical protein